jgi:hypothetical protein
LPGATDEVVPPRIKPFIAGLLAIPVRVENSPTYATKDHSVGPACYISRLLAFTGFFLAGQFFPN